LSESETSAKKTLAPLPDAERSQVLKSRACLIGFPWVQPADWPDDKPYHGERVDANEMRAIRNSVAAYKSGNKSLTDPIQRQIAAREKRHYVDVDQYLLFADFMLLLKLQGEGRFEEASSETERLINGDHLKAVAVPWTTADEATYFSSQNLQNLILLKAATIRVRTKIKSPSQELSFLVRYLDARAGLKNVFGRLNLTDQTSELVQRVAMKDWYALSEPSSVRNDKLSKLPFVVGAASKDDGYMVVLKGRHMYAFEASDQQDSASLLNGSEAADAYTSILTSELSASSSPEMKLFAVSRFADKYELMLPDGPPILLSAEELAALKTGKSLPDSHELSKTLAGIGDTPLVLYTNPLTLRDSVQRAAGDDVAYAIQRSYPQSTVILDPLSDKTKEQIANLRGLGVNKSARVTAIVAEKTFSVKDFKLVQNIEQQLESNGVTVLRIGSGQIHWTAESGQVVLVITGHIDSQLAAFVRLLGDAGVLKDNYVVFNSCRAKLSRQLATEMTTHYGATAVFSYDSQITPERLEPVLLKAPARVEEKSDVPFIQWWRKSIEEQKLSGVWNVCWIGFDTNGLAA